jgi:hypothetical protein
MKRLLSFGLLLVVGLVLVGCGGDQGTTPATPPADTAKPATPPGGPADTP